MIDTTLEENAKDKEETQKDQGPKDELVEGESEEKEAKGTEKGETLIEGEKSNVEEKKKDSKSILDRLFGEDEVKEE